jgi:hypothetical protein
MTQILSFTANILQSIKLKQILRKYQRDKRFEKIK